MSAARQRFCFQLRVKPARLAEYLEWHRAVWPELLAELHEGGWRNYSLFSRGDGVIIGYFETEDRAAGDRRLAKSEVNNRWQASMAPFFDDDLTGSEGHTELIEIFNLERQLSE